MRNARRTRDGKGRGKKRNEGKRSEKEREVKRERERERVVGGGSSYASGVRPFVRVANVNVGTVR